MSFREKHSLSQGIQEYHLPDNRLSGRGLNTELQGRRNNGSLMPNLYKNKPFRAYIQAAEQAKILRHEGQAAN